MKKNKILAASLFFGCACAFSPALAQEQTVTLTTAKAAGSDVTLLLNRTSGLSVDWGNGTFVPVEKGTDDIITLKGTVQGSTITVKGGNTFVMLGCAGNELTAVDASQAPSLQSLYCQNNAIETLNITGLKALTDLNCANNKLTELVLSTSAYPALETVNISGNELSGNFNLQSHTALRYVDVSNNDFSKVYVSSSRNLSALLASNNSASGDLNVSNCGELSVLAFDGNAYKRLISSTGLSALRQLVCADNALTTLSLGDCASLKVLACQRNNISSITFEANTVPSVMHCDGNALNFTSFPKTKPAVFTADDQTPVDISSLLTNGGTFYYVPICPSYADRNTYYLDMADYRKDAAGRTVIQFAASQVDDAGNVVALEKGTGSSNPKDYTVTTGKLSFYKALKEAFVVMTHPAYAGVEITSSHFAVYDAANPDGIATVTADGLTIEAGNGVLTLTSGSSVSVNVYSIDGKSVWSGNVGTGVTTVSLPKGVYVVNGKKVII